jgi:CBS domain-containing protein
MQTDLVTLSPETRLLDVHRLFIEEEIHGAPVVDEAGLLVGVVSILDLSRAVAEQLARDEFDPIAATAADVMTRELVTVAPNSPMVEVAEKMNEQHVHRVLVVEDRELVGVITSFDLVRAFTREKARPGQRIDYDPSA